MADKKTIYRHYSEELNKLSKEVADYRKQNEYFYPNAMIEFFKRYNGLLKKYYGSSGIPLEKLIIYDYEYSETKKTIRDVCVNRLLIALESTRKLVDEMLEKEREEAVKGVIPSNQMRRCPKIGIDRCPKNPSLDNNLVFVGMPFKGEYKDSYEYGIKIVLDSIGKEAYKADAKIQNQDVMCKICEQMQKAKYLIFNISELNPNVMFELGLSYGLGKETIILKDKSTDTISDLSNTEYIEYTHAGDIQNKLRRYFEGK